MKPFGSLLLAWSLAAQKDADSVVLQVERGGRLMYLALEHE